MCSRPKTKIWAHRGSSIDRPENTMAAFEQAVNLGADGLELDVHLTKDEVPVVIHDETFDRTSNGITLGRVYDALWSDCQTYNLGLHFTDGEYPLVSLEAVLNRFKNDAISINIELKTDVIDYPNICERVLQVCERSGFPMENLFLSSFHAPSLLQLNILKPGLKLGLLFSKFINKPGDLATKSGATALHPHYYFLYLPFYIWRYRKRFPIYTWTVDHPLVLKLLFWLKIDAVITNNPALALQIRDKKGRRR